MLGMGCPAQLVVVTYWSAGPELYLSVRGCLGGREDRAITSLLEDCT